MSYTYNKDIIGIVDDCYCKKETPVNQEEKVSINDIINDLIHETENYCANSCLEENKNNTNENNKTPINYEFLAVLKEFKEKMDYFSGNEYQFDKVTSDLESNNYINDNTPKVLMITSKDTSIILDLILSENNIVEKINDEKFMVYYNLRNFIIKFRKKLKEAKFPNLNYYSANLNLLEYFITNYLILSLMRFSLLNGIGYSGSMCSCKNEKPDEEIDCCHKYH